jgi:hypothetical protein
LRRRRPRPVVAVVVPRLLLLRFFLRPAYGVLLLGQPLPLLFTGSTAISLVTLESIKEVRNTVLNDEVNHGKVHRENENRDYDHSGRGSHFLPRGRGHFAHFGAHVVVEGLGTFRPGFYRRH